MTVINTLWDYGDTSSLEGAMHVFSLVCRHSDPNRRYFTKRVKSKNTLRSFSQWFRVKLLNRLKLVDFGAAHKDVWARAGRKWTQHRWHRVHTIIDAHNYRPACFEYCATLRMLCGAMSCWRFSQAKLKILISAEHGTRNVEHGLELVLWQPVM